MCYPFCNRCARLISGYLCMITQQNALFCRFFCLLSAVLTFLAGPPCHWHPASLSICIGRASRTPLSYPGAGSGRKRGCGGRHKRVKSGGLACYRWSIRVLARDRPAIRLWIKSDSYACWTRASCYQNKKAARRRLAWVGVYQA